MRPIVIHPLSETIPVSPHQITLAPANSDPLWLSLDANDGSVIKLDIDGYSESATILTSGTPQANEVAIADAVNGILEFSPDDAGKTVTGSVLYMRKIHSTEVL